MSAHRSRPQFHFTALALVASLLIAQRAKADDVEPNETPVTATPITLVDGAARIQGNIFPNADVDFYSFPAVAGDRIYAAVQTSTSASGETDSQLRLFAVDGITELEFDEDNGTFGALSSSLAGTVIPTTGTYFLRVNHLSATKHLRGYDLYLQVRSGSPTVETEPNDSFGAPNPATFWASGARNPAMASEQDYYPLTLAAGDTAFLSLDLDPERDGTSWNGRIAFGLFGDAANQLLVANDANNAEVLPNAPSEAFFLTVKEAGTYYVMIDSATAVTGGPTATYHLNISVLPEAVETWTTHTSTDIPKAIGPDPGLVSSTITVPGNPRIRKIRVRLNLTHNLMTDLDVHLRSPAGNDIGLITDVGSAAPGLQTQMDLVLSDDAAIQPAFTVSKGLVFKPELAYRLSWLKGIDAGGVWTLDLRDDQAAEGGTLNGWSLEIVEDPGPPAGTTIYSTDFESDDGGFTHSGTADEWERGLPSFAPVIGANSGVNCWKTDLDNSYESNSDQDLFSPDIDLTSVTAGATLIWAQKYQMEAAQFDSAFVEVQEVGGGGQTRKVWEWLDATMTSAVGNPVTTIQESSGWSRMHADISDFAGKTVRIRFNVKTDNTTVFAGLAIDDVSVTALSPQLTIGLPKRFRSTTIGRRSKPQQVLVTNVGGQAATGVTLELSGKARRDFRISPPASTLAAGAATSFSVTFKPKAAGIRKATVSAKSDAPTVSAPLSGKGKAK